MRRTFIILSFVALTFGAFAQGGYRVQRGERPAIDLEKVPTDAYEQGVVKIKLANGMDKQIPAKMYFATSKGYVETGVEPIDCLNSAFGATEFMPLLHNLYSSKSKSNEFKARHQAWGFHLWFVVKIDSKTDVKQAIKQYMNLNEVEIAEPVYKKKLISNVAPRDEAPKGEALEENEVKADSRWTPNDTRFTNQWHYNNTGQNSGTADKDIDLPEAWQIEKGYDQVIVAVIDGGIQTNHPDLSANIWSGKGYNFVTNSPTLDPQDHGTHVAGTIAAVTNNNVGVAGIAGGSGSGNGVRLMSCQVFNSTTSGGFDDAPIYAADNGASISQNSWGYTSANVYDQSTLDAIDYFNTNGGGNALNGGITIFAAGNDNATGNWYPGCYSGTLSVAATNNKDVRSYYSNYGTWVDISAPGGEQSYSNDPKGVLSTITGSSYSYYQGTSMACPHVSGVAALLISNAYRNGLVLTRTQLAKLLTENVDNHYSLNSSYSGKLGSGRLNAQLALNALQSMLGTTGQAPSTPTGLSTSAITTNSATLSWNAVSGATQYTVKVGSNTYTTTNSSYALTGLTPNTSYTWSVMASNSYGNSSYSSSKQFTTSEATSNPPASANGLPFNESFGASMPSGWTTQNSSSSITQRWSMSNTNKAGGTAYEAKCSYQNITGTTRLISPAINTQGVSAATLTFKHMLDAYKAGPVLKVQTSTDLSTWSDAWSVNASASDIAASTVSVNLSKNLNSSTTYIAFVVTGNLYYIDYWYIDNVSVVASSGGTTPNPDPVSYCSSKGSNSSYEWIDLVQFEGINRTSANDGGYADMTSMQATVCPGENLTMYLSAGFKSSSYTEYWAVWIDFDQNGSFSNDEKVVSGSSSSSATLSASVAIPASAKLGATRMRVSMKYNAAQTSACETFSYGEVEDYSVNVVRARAAASSQTMFAEQLGNETNDLFQVYPNPATSTVNVVFEGIEDELPISIYDALGRQVHRMFSCGQTTAIDIDSLPSGVYYITVEDHKMPVTKKFVKL